MAKRKSSQDEICPAYRTLQFTVTEGASLLPAHWPLPQSIEECFPELRSLVYAVAEFDELLRRLNDATVTVNPGPAKDSAQFSVHVIGWELHRLRKTLPRFKSRFPPYPTIPSFGGKAGESFADIALQIGGDYWQWFNLAQPMKTKNNGRSYSRLLSVEELGEWEYAKRLGEYVGNELDYFASCWTDDGTDYDELLNLLAVEAKRVKSERRLINDQICDYVHSLATRDDPVRYGKMPAMIKDQFGKMMDPDAIKTAYHRWKKKRGMK